MATINTSQPLYIPQPPQPSPQPPAPDQTNAPQAPVSPASIPAPAVPSGAPVPNAPTGTVANQNASIPKPTLPKETFWQGMSAVWNPQFTTDALGNGIRAEAAAKPSFKGILGGVLAGALQGALAGMRSSPPRGTTSGSVAFSTAAKEAYQEHLDMIKRRRDYAQQNFQNQMAAKRENYQNALMSAQTMSIQQNLQFKAEEHPGVLRAQKLGNEAAELKIKSGNLALKENAQKFYDQMQTIFGPQLASLAHIVDNVNSSEGLLHAQPVVKGQSALTPNPDGGPNSSIIWNIPELKSYIMTQPFMYNTYDGTFNSDGSLHATEHILTPDGKATAYDALQDYYIGQHQLYMLQQVFSAQMTLEQHAAAVKESKAKAAMEMSTAELNEMRANMFKSMGVQMPTNFQPPPNPFAMSQDSLQQYYAQQGVNLPQFDALYAVGHYQTDLDTFYTRMSGLYPTLTRGAAVDMIRRFINPNYQQQTYKAVQKMQEEFANLSRNAPGGTVVAYNTAAAHLYQLSQAAKALSQNDLPAANAILNTMGRQTGATPTIAFNLIRAGLAGEIAATFKGGTPDIPGVEDIEKQMKSSESPQQLQTFAIQAAHMLASKSAALATPYWQLTQSLPPVFDQNTLDIYQKLGVNPAQGMPAGANVVAGQVTMNPNPTQLPQSPANAPAQGTQVNAPNIVPVPKNLPQGAQPYTLHGSYVGYYLNGVWHAAQ